MPRDKISFIYVRSNHLHVNYLMKDKKTKISGLLVQGAASVKSALIFGIIIYWTQKKEKEEAISGPQSHYLNFQLESMLSRCYNLTFFYWQNPYTGRE